MLRSMPSDENQRRRSGPLIGILLDHIESDYHVEMIAAAVRVATRRGARTLILPGGALNSEGKPGRSRGFLYSGLATAELDGLLLLGGSLSNYSGLEGFERFSRTLPSLPTLVVGLASRHSVSVAVNNHHGVSKLIDHLVRDHGRRRIAFIAGPKESSEAQIRRQAYVDGVERHQLGLGSRYIVPGGLGREQGIDAVVHLLEDRRMTPAELDAIVAVNDDVALGVLDELERRGLSVPDDVAVVGFDDAPNAHAASPPLTTVSQRVWEQGATAMTRLLDAISRKESLSPEELLPDVILRASCGCEMSMQNDARTRRGSRAELTLAGRSIEDQAHDVARELRKVARGRILGGDAWEDELVDGLLKDLKGQSRTFVSGLSQLAQRVGDTGIDACHDVLTQVRLLLLERLPDRDDRIAKAEDIFQEARLALANVSLFSEREHHAAQAHHLRVIARACLDRAHGSGLGELAVALEEQLPLFGLRHFVVSKGSSDSLLVIARSDKRAGTNDRVRLSDFGRDAALLAEAHVVVLPLSASKQQVGLAALSYFGADPFLFEHLRDLLGMALGIDTPRPEGSAFPPSS